MAAHAGEHGAASSHTPHGRPPCPSPQQQPPTPTSRSSRCSAARSSIAAGGCMPPGCINNPTNAHTDMVGGKVQFENDNYRITAGDDNTVNITQQEHRRDLPGLGRPAHEHRRQAGLRLLGHHHAAAGRRHQGHHRHHALGQQPQHDAVVQGHHHQRRLRRADLGRGHQQDRRPEVRRSAAPRRPARRAGGRRQRAAREPRRQGLPGRWTATAASAPSTRSTSTRPT